MTTFPYGAAWQLHLVSGPANTTFSFCGKHDSAAVVCAPSFGTTDANGIWNSSGAFTGSSAPGFWLEWIQFPDGTNSNQVSFTVSQPVTTSQAQNLSQTADILQAMQGILQALSKLAQ